MRVKSTQNYLRNIVRLFYLLAGSLVRGEHFFDRTKLGDYQCVPTFSLGARLEISPTRFVIKKKTTAKDARFSRMFHFCIELCNFRIGLFDDREFRTYD